MKKILFLAMSIFNFFSASANNYDALWKNVHNAEDRDLPKNAMSVLQDIAKLAKNEKNYGEYLAAKLYYARVEAEVTPDSLTPAINRLKAEAVEAEATDELLAAVYNTVLGKLCLLSRDDAENTGMTVEQLSEAYFDKALRNPDLLAATKSEAYDRLLQRRTDDTIYNSDMLSIIGHEAKRYEFLKDYYMAHGNRRAACIEFMHMADNESVANDDMAITKKKNMLNAGMEEYADLPESALFAGKYFELLASDNDVSEQTRYNYLVSAIDKYSKYDNDIYCNHLRNKMASLTRPQFHLEVDNGIVLKNIINVKELKIDFIQLNTDGTKEYRLYEDKELQKVMKLATGYVQTINRSYDRPVWESHCDTLQIPAMPYGVYLVKAAIGTAESRSLFYHTDLSVLTMAIGNGKESDKSRIIVVSKTTGAPVANADIIISKESYYDNDSPKTLHLTSDANGETMFDGSFNANRIWVYTSVKNGCKHNDNAFRKSSFYGYVRYEHSKERNDIATILTDRAIYRPGQTVKGTVIVHNAKETDSISVVAGKSLTVNIYNPDGKKVGGSSVKTNELGHAGFEFVLPDDGKNGEYDISCSSYDIRCHGASIRVEEYKRPTFEVNVVEPEKYASTLKVDDSNGAKTINVRFKANTYSQIPVQNADVTYSVKRKKRITRWWWRDYEDVPPRIITESATTKTDADGCIDIPVMPLLPEKDNGTYIFTINVKVTDRSGETHEQVQNIYVSRGKETAEAAQEEPKPDFEVSADAFPRDGGKLTFVMRNSKPAKTYAYYTLFNGMSIVESGQVTFNSEYKRDFSYKPEYGEALTMTYVWMMDGVEHEYSRSILKPQPDLDLPVKWVTFRDRTQPGSSETWTLKVGNDNAKSALAATIYDKSLDALYPLQWYMKIIHNYYYHSAEWKCFKNTLASLSLAIRPDYLKDKSDFYFAQIDDEKLPYRSYYSRYLRRAKIGGFAVRGNDAMPMAMVEEKAMVADADTKNTSDKAMTRAKGESAEEKPADLSGLVRSDLVESAFFTPSIISDDEGKITLSFQMPETMTTWRLCGLVHDDHMRYAMLDTTCVAQKDIIVKPNVPRFLRETDKAVFAATVSNTTGKRMNSEVIMQLLIPETNAVVWEKKQRIDIDGGKTADVAFEAPAISNDSLLIYRIAATAADGSSDGEQHYIPVLPGTELVTTSIAFTQHEMGRYVHDISNLFFDGSRDRQLKIKYAPYAVQMIIDAIPAASRPNRKDAFSLASATYVSTLFNNDDALRTDVTRQLGELQLGNGGWPWWQGMKSSVCTTTSIARLLARLNYQGSGNESTDKMLTKSLNYLMNYAKDEAKNLRIYQKKHPEAKLHPSEICTDILYTFALCKNSGNDKAISLLTKNKKDVAYLIDLVEKVPAEMTIYGKAHAAALLAYYGRIKKAVEHLESMKQYSVCTEEAGRYYDSPKAYYSWRNYKIPTQVAAIEALRIVAPHDTLTIEEMKRWLLHEKRTQQWDNSVNTADAVYAFMLNNGEAAMLRNGTAPADTNVLTLDGNEMPNDTIISIDHAREFSVEKTTPGTSWGAVFVSQRAPLSSLKTQGTGFKLKREIISGGKPLEVGSRITVRITIDADRDYDYVEVCDRRAACLEPVEQLSGYQSAITGGTARGSYSGYYRITHDNNTEFFFDRLAKGTHVIETDYYVDRVGNYQQGSCTVSCAYASEFNALYAPENISVE